MPPPNWRLLRSILPLLLWALSAATPTLAAAQIKITLRRSFIEQHKNRVTIAATFTVDRAHERPNAPSKDGDLHVAGRAPEVQLPIVAELMNAAADPDAVDRIHAAETSGAPVSLTGAWRIWCEHGGSDEQRQGAALQPFTTTNPAHVFEIHPVTRIDDHSTVTGWVPIEGYEPKTAEDAFERYESKSSRIRVNAGNTVTITTAGVGFNYVRFKMVLNGNLLPVDDGFLAMAQVLDLNDELLVRNRRMAFAAGTAPAQRVSTMQAGDTLEVLGIPRINLAILSWRVRNAGSRPEVLTWNLPYEMIIVGMYGQ